MAEERLYPYESASILLGCLLKNPSLMLREDFNIKGEDFSYLFHRVLYFGIRNLFNRGSKEIDEISFDIFIQDYKEYLEVCKDNNYLEVIPELKNMVDVSSFDYHYDTFTKYSLLRYYRDCGFDISEFYDTDKEDKSQRENLNLYTKESIIEYFEKININAKKEYLGNNDIRYLKIGDKLEDVVAQYKKAPLYGFSTISEYFNTVCRGIVRGQFSCYSMPSGGGKSTVGVSTLVNACCKEIYDTNLDKWVENHSYQGGIGLYIQYELDTEYELSPKFLSAISKVPTNHILNGSYANGEEERVARGIELLKESEIYSVLMPSFTLASINQIVEEYVITKHINIVVFDYLSEQANLSREIAKSNGGVSTRSDQVLSSLSSGLKDLAIKYDLAMLTFTQTNANLDMQDILDAGCISGARAIQNKLDVGVIIAPLKQKEKKVADEYIDIKSSRGFGNGNKPNRIIHCYKIRFGSEAQHLKIWGYLNLGTGEWTDCFVTDAINQPYKMDKTQL